MNKHPQCTCPHQYKENGLVRFGTDYKCKVHGVKDKPDELHNLHLLLAEANGTLIVYVQELEKAGMLATEGRAVVRKICAKIGTPNQLEN